MTISNINNQYYTTFLSDLLRSQISNNSYYTTFLSDLLHSQIGNNSYYCIQILGE